MLGDDQTIVFNHIISNEGNGYDSANGIFTAKVSGVYVFYVQIRGVQNYACLVDIVNHGTTLTSTWVSDYGADSSMVVYRLNAGDQIWIRNTHNLNDRCKIDDYSSFSGFLLYQQYELNALEFQYF